jgi:carbonic anhydrase
LAEIQGQTMRLLEAIIDANHRALAGDANAGLHPADFESELPIVALTCIDARLNSILPQVLGVPSEQFIWLRNAGNIITSPTSSTMRSLALACAVKGGKEIVIIGHTDCQVSKTSTMQLIERLRALGIERHLLPDNLNEYFGVFSSERQNVIKGSDIARHSPLMGPKIPVHGLMVDIQTGKLEWLVNGYQTLETLGDRWNEVVHSAGQTVDSLKSLTDFQIGGLKFPETKIGEAVNEAESWVSDKLRQLEVSRREQSPPQAGPVQAALNSLFQPQVIPPPPSQEHPAAAPPPRIPVPPPLRPRVRRRGSS